MLTGVRSYLIEYLPPLIQKNGVSYRIIVGLAALLPDKNPRKLEFAFLFDVDGSGKITAEEMVHVFELNMEASMEILKQQNL